MNINNSLQLRQQQKLIMTPKLLQSIQILQMPIAELVNEVQRQIQENPVVEMSDTEKPDYSEKFDEASGVVSETLQGFEGQEAEKAPVVQEGPDGISGYEKDQETVNLKIDNQEIDWEQYYDDLEKTTHREEKEFEFHEQVSFENFVTGEKTLSEHLLEQLRANVFSEKEMAIGRTIIGHIDGAGYLKANCDDILKHADLAGENVTASDVEEVLETVQSFEPSGVGARNAQECLLLQYQALDDADKDPILERLIKNHLEDISEKRYKNIAHTLDLTVPEVQEYIEYIKANFDPKPGLKYASSDGNANVVPEVFIEKSGEEYVVTVNDYDVPRIKINPRYEAIIRSKNAPREVLEFIKEKLDKARFIMKSIEQRRDTIKRVVECIIRHQREFFEHGVSHMKPLILNEVAGELGLDESTISRVTSGKYAQTPRGVLELKYFFSAALRSSIGEDVSTKSVKDMIKTMVLAEPPEKPLSDQAIVEELGKKGIQIARRTVTKYREELKIPSSSKRKRYS